MNEMHHGRSTRQVNATQVSTWSEVAPATAAQKQVPLPLRAAHAEKEQLLNTALDEYCRLQAQGSQVTPSQFCDRYPSYRHSLRRLLDVQDELDGIDIDEFHWPERGSDFLGFQILGELGAGAIARVYLAIQTEVGGRFVALKVSHGRGDEANTLGKLSHPHIVPVYSVVYDPETELSAVCMPYQGSATLADLLDLAFESKQPPRSAKIILRAGRRREEFIDSTSSKSKKPRPVHPVLEHGSYVDGVALLGRQIAEALAYTHAQRILHRDLKPSNVLLTPDGFPMLLDFNLSIDLSSQKLRIGGTLPYMPPEQIRDVHVQPFLQTRLDDPRSDLFSLGVILYELLTGCLPFGDPPAHVAPREAAESYLQKQQQKPTPIRQLNSAVDRHLAMLVHRCLESEIEARPASAQEVVDCLRGHFSTLRRANRWSRRHFLLTGAAALSVAVPAGWGAVHLATRPAYPERLYQAGVKDYLAGRSHRAAQQFTKVMELTGESNEVLFARGAAWMQGGDYDWAAKDFSKVFFENQDALAGKCYAYSSAMNLKYDEGYTAYRLVAEVTQSRDAQDHLHVAYCYHKAHNYVEAEVWATKALALEPDNVMAYCLRAETRLRVTEDPLLGLRETYKPLAVADFERAVELKSDDPMLLCRAATAYCRLDSFNIGHVVNLLERAVSAGAVRKQLSLVAARQPWKEDAWFQDLLRRCPDTENNDLSSWPQILMRPDDDQLQSRVTEQVAKQSTSP